MINKLTLVGRLGQDPTASKLSDDRLMAVLNVATEERYKNKESASVAHTTWHRVVFFGGLAKVCTAYLTKGKLVYIEAKLANSSYTDKEDIVRYRVDIIGTSMQMLGGSRRDEASVSLAPTKEEQVGATSSRVQEGKTQEEELPF